MKRVVVVAADLYRNLKGEIDLLLEDWKEEGADEVEVIKYPKGCAGSVTDLRDKLKSIEGIEGALLLGDLPVARMVDADMPNAPYETDYFFMELEKRWTASPKNIVRSNEYPPPAISIGRVILGPETGFQMGNDKPTATEFYKNYLMKLHLYRWLNRLEEIPAEYRLQPKGIKPKEIKPKALALMINDLDDPNGRLSQFSHLYQRGAVESFSQVGKELFLRLLATREVEWLWTLAHSGGNAQNLTDGSVINGCDYLSSKMFANFIQLESCSIARLVWEDQWDPVNPGTLKLQSDPFVSNILFAPFCGVNVIGASASRAFPNVTQFFDTLKTDKVVGLAFKKWIGLQATNNWSGGGRWMILFGDPFIYHRYPRSIPRIRFDAKSLSPEFKKYLRSFVKWLKGRK